MRDCMKEQPLAGFENLSEQWWDNPEDAGGFSHGKGSPSCYAPVYSHRGVALFFPAIPNERGNKTPTSFAKSGSSVLNSNHADLQIVFPL